MPGILSRVWGATCVRTLVAVSVAVTFHGCGRDDKAAGGSSSGPQPVHSLKVDGIGADLAADSNIMVVAAKSSGLHIFNTAQPERPVVVGSVDLPYAYRALVQGTMIFGLDETQGLSFLNLKNLTQLQLTHALSAVELYGYVADAVWAGNTLLFASESVGLTSYGVAPELGLAGNRSGQTQSALSAHAVSLTPQRMFTASFRGELRVYQLAATGALDAGLTLQHTVPFSHQVSDLACSTSHCFTTGLGKGLYVYAIPDSGRPELAAHLQTSEAVSVLALDADLLLAAFLDARGANGFHVYNVEKADAPVLRHKAVTGAAVKDFQWVGDWLYVLLADGGLNIYPREALR